MCRGAARSRLRGVMQFCCWLVLGLLVMEHWLLNNLLGILLAECYLRVALWITSCWGLEIWDRGDVLAEALRTILWEGRQHELQRSAVFIKRLATIALCFGSAESLAALVTLKHLLLKNSKCRSLLENDVGGGSLSGLVAKYQLDASHPNLSGALASVLWELSLLSKHYNPTVSIMASNISSMVTLNPSQNPAYLSTTSHVQAFADLSLKKVLLKPIGKLGSLNRKRKMGQKEEFVIMSPDQVRRMGSSVDEDEVKSNLGDYFMVLKDIGKKERLMADLNRTLSSISLYKEYKRQKKWPKSQKSLRGKVKFSSL